MVRAMSIISELTLFWVGGCVVFSVVIVSVGYARLQRARLSAIADMTKAHAEHLRRQHEYLLVYRDYGLRVLNHLGQSR